MQFDKPDPAYTSSERARTSFRLAMRISLVVVLLLWVIFIADWGLGLGLTRFGVRPRDLSGLAGVLFAPILHGNLAHLFANSLPLLVLGSMMLHLYPRASLRVLPALYLGPGVLVWLLGRSSVHLGASGLVYGLAAYIFIAGVLRRDLRALAAAMLVSFLYGGMVWGILPLQPGVSWETHLAAGLIGAGLAIALRRLDVPPRQRYDWEEQD